jgi:hypothetical protein
LFCFVLFFVFCFCVFSSAYNLEFFFQIQFGMFFFKCFSVDMRELLIIFLSIHTLNTDCASRTLLSSLCPSLYFSFCLLYVCFRRMRMHLQLRDRARKRYLMALLTQTLLARKAKQKQKL